LKAAQKSGRAALCEDESIFIYDSLSRYIWAPQGTKPIILTTGSHRRTCLFGALSLEGRQLFRQYPNVNGENFLKYLKKLKKKFSPMLLFLDRSLPHHKDQAVSRWLRENRQHVRVRWFPTARPELNPIEECWNILKDELQANRLYPTFEEMKRAIKERTRTKRFNLNLINYLC